MSRSYAERSLEEVETFREQETVHDLPPIFHYWANKHLKGKLEDLGYANSQDFLVKNIARAPRTDGKCAVISYGCGNGDVEIGVALRLREQGSSDFHFTCVDINPEMLQRGREAAESNGLADCFSFVQSDVSELATEDRTYDVHLANQSLHHFVMLEGLFEVIERGMTEDSIFLVCDMIGRNGHMRWPETLVVVEKLWSQLRPRHKYNHQLARFEAEFDNFDCSQVGFEGVRAQDIMALLSERFSFEDTVAFGGIVDVFVDRSFGPNFDTSNPEDLAFVDYVQLVEHELLASGSVFPTQIIARLRRRRLAAPSNFDVGAIVRSREPAKLPDVSAIAFTFSNNRRIAQFSMDGENDSEWIVDGFHEWEDDSSSRWASERFSVQFMLPDSNNGYSATVNLECWVPEDVSTEAGLDVYANGVHVRHFSDVYSKLNKLSTLSVPLRTLGGRIVLSFLFERAQKPPGEDDRRALTVVVRGASLNAEH